MYLLKVPFVSAVYYSNKRIIFLGKKINWYSFIIDRFDTNVLFLNSALLYNKLYTLVKSFLSLLVKEMPAPSSSTEGRRKWKSYLKNIFTF